MLKGTIKVYNLDCKRSRLINYCSIRFIEKYDSISVLVALFQSVYVTLEEISRDTKRKISSKAAAFLAYRDNHETQTTEDYFRIACFLPSLDTLKEHLKTCFLMNSKTLSAFQILVPISVDPKHCDKIIDLAMYYEDRLLGLGDPSRISIVV